MFRICTIVSMSLAACGGGDSSSVDAANDTFSQVQSVAASELEAVDRAPIRALPGWSATSGAVPP